MIEDTANFIGIVYHVLEQKRNGQEALCVIVLSPKRSVEPDRIQLTIGMSIGGGIAIIVGTQSAYKAEGGPVMVQEAA